MLTEAVRQFPELLAIKGYIAEDGRPVAERHSFDYVLKQLAERGIPIGTIPSTQPDYRFGTATNIHAYEALEQDFPKIASSISWMNRALVPEATSRHLTIGEAVASAFGGSALPIYLVNRQRNPFPANEVPTHAANVYKVTKGLLGSLNVISSRDMENIELPAEVIMKIIEQEEMLVDGGQACPAPETQIRTAMTVLIENVGNPARSPLNELLPEDEIPTFTKMSRTFSELQKTLRELAVHLEKINKDFANIPQRVIDLILKEEIDKLFALRRELDLVFGKTTHL